MKQLTRLAQKVDQELVKKAPQGKYGDYISHSTITELLLAIIGVFSFDIKEIIRGYAPEVKTKNKLFEARENAAIGVLATLTCIVDGQQISITEVGSEDSPAMSNDAENIKNAASDALKRCAMRLGLGLHLWSKQDYVLDKMLLNKDEPKLEPEQVEYISPSELGRLQKSLLKMGFNENQQLQLISELLNKPIDVPLLLTKYEATKIYRYAERKANDKDGFGDVEFDDLPSASEGRA